MSIIRTVLGDVAPESLGITMIHEHLCSDFGIWQNEDDLCLSDPVVVGDELALAARAGVRAVVDATTPEIGGRDVTWLRSISQRAQVQIIAGAGLYRELTYPQDIASRAVEELTAAFVREVVEGIDDTDVKAGVFGEIGLDPSGITPVEEKVTRAVAAASRATGAPIVSHTPEGAWAIEQLDLLEAAGADPAKVLIGHLDCSDSAAVSREVARRGAYVGFDRFGIAKFQRDTRRVEMLLELLSEGLASSIMLSSDLARPSRLISGGGPGYGNVLTEIVPRLRERGVDQQTLDVMLVDNPRRFLAFDPIN